MIELDDELSQDYLSECTEHLATMESDLLAIERGGADIDEELVNRVFRAVHSIKGGAGFFDLTKIRELAHRTENVLALIRSRKMPPTPDRIRVLLRAADRLDDMIRHPGTSNQVDISEIVSALDGLCGELPASTGESTRKESPAAAGRERAGGRHLRTLLVEDDFASRLLLQTFLSRYGECHVAVNGREAVEAARSALERKQSYDLICMDIMMPEMDGRQAVRRIRALEEGRGILSTYGAKIIMTTAVDDIKEVIRCFKDLCDAYLMKPIDLGELLRQMRDYRLVE